MSILSRFSTIMKSNINAALDKLEDPSKMVDQMLIDLNKDLVAVKKETASVMANERNAKRLRDEAQMKVDRFTDLAEKALLSGSEDDAMVFMGKVQEEEANLETAKTTHLAAMDNANKMKAMFEKLQSQIRELEGRKAQIKAKAQIAKTQQKVAAATSRASGDKGIAAFDRLENKVNQQFDQAAAMMELSEEKKCPVTELADKYKTGGSSSATASRLAEMKARLGMDDTPREN